MGFTADYSNYDAEFRAVSRVYEKYYAALMTGTVDPDDYLPKLMEELQNAGNRPPEAGAPGPNRRLAPQHIEMEAATYEKICSVGTIP